MAKPLGFKDFVNVDYTNSGDPQLAYNAQKRKRDIPTGNTGEQVAAKKRKTEEVETEALDVTQRRARGRMMKRNKAKIALGRKRASRKIASQEVIKKRLRKKVRSDLLKKLTKGVAKDDLAVARKKDLEKRLEAPAYRRRIDMMVKKQLPKARRAEIEKKRGKKSAD